MSAFAALWRLLRIRVRRARRDWQRPKGGPAGRLRRRLALGGFVLTFLFAALAFPDSIFRSAKALCELPPDRSGFSDFCGDVGVPGIPARPERLAWEAVRPGDCQMLRDYARRFPSGVFRDETQRRLAARRVERSSAWTSSRREVRGFISRRQSPLATREAAVADARDQVAGDARELGCQTIDEHQRLMRVEIMAATPTCRQITDGYTCSLDYRAICHLAEQRAVEICG